VRSLLKENGQLFPRAIGRQFRDRVREMLGEGHPLRAIPPTPLLGVCNRVRPGRVREGAERETGRTLALWARILGEADPGRTTNALVVDDRAH
jgi:hypothetical protein